MSCEGSMVVTFEDCKRIGHEEMWKYLASAKNALESMRLYRHAIKACISEKEDKFKSILAGETPMTERDRCSFPPGNNIWIDGICVNIDFMVCVFNQSFYQYARNCFDYMAQAIVEYERLRDKIRLVDFDELAKYCRSNDSVCKNFVVEIFSNKKYARI